MLQTQVGYWQNVETKRHNLVTESQNAIDLGIKQDTLRESVRHNQESERISWFNAQETQRHNLVNEDISWFNSHETQRHNRVTESLGYGQLGESIRHNKTAEDTSFINATTKIREADIKSRTADAQIEKYNREAEKARADADYADQKSRTETSVRFNNWTQGARNISSVARDVSDIASTWMSISKGGAANDAANVIRRAAKAASKNRR